jgi:hypothetical protein
MARIELRHTTVRFIDGYTLASGAIADTPVSGDTTLTVDGFVGLLQTGVRIQFAGANRNYYVTAVSGSPNTTSITFTPALLTADGIPAGTAAITVLGHSSEIKVGNGNLTYTISQEVLYDLDRGDLDTVREGDEQPMSISLDLVWEEVRSISSDTTPTPEEALRNYGAASGWTTSAADPCEPYSVDIEVEVMKPCGGVELEIYTFPDFRWESIDHNVSDAMLSTSGRCNATAPTIVRRTWN